MKSITSLLSLSKHASASEQQEIIERELAKVRSIISKTRGFSSLEQQHLDSMIAAGERTAYNKEELLILQNDVDVGYFFVLLEGCLKYIVRSDSEEPKSGLINSTDHGNVVGHFGALYRRVRDSSVYSVAGSVVWKFSFEGIPGAALPSCLPLAPACQCVAHRLQRVSRLMPWAGFVMRVEPHQKPLLPQASQAVIPQDWADKYSRSVREVEQLRGALESGDAQLQLAQSALSECRTRCASLEITVASQELQLQALLSQSALEKSSFVQEKEHLQLLFDRQQQLCAGLTAQVVALTANSDRLHLQINDNSMKLELEKEQLIKDAARWEAAVALEQQKCSDAVSRTRAVEAAFAEAECRLASLQSANFEQAKTIAEISQELQAAMQQVSEFREQNAILNQVSVTAPPYHPPIFCITALLLFLPRFFQNSQNLREFFAGHVHPAKKQRLSNRRRPGS